MRTILAVAGVAIALALPASASAATCSGGYVALTFDDGPTTLTRQYVDTLVANGAKATFFDVGANVRARPADVKYTVQRGMAIGNHTQTHPHLLTWSPDGVYWEISDASYYIKQASGYVPELFRPPYGESDGSIWDTAWDQGMIETSWSIDTRDWSGISSEQITENALADVAGNDIILLHDGYESTRAAIPGIVSGLEARNLCTGLLEQSWDDPVESVWGWPIWVTVVP